MIVYLFLVLQIILTSSNVDWYNVDNFRLPQREAVEIGYKQNVQINLGETHVMKTLSVNPPIFEVPNFLSSEECEYLIFLAKRTGLKESPLHPENDNFKTTYEVFSEWDVDNSSFVELAEFTYIKDKGNLYITELEVMEMIDRLRIDKNGDNRMDFSEFKAITAERIRAYYDYFIENFPHLRSRYSFQSWIWHYGAYDHLLEGFHERISRLTKLPHQLIEKSEPMQVVKYVEGGHYHCHHDSTDHLDDKESISCCTHGNAGQQCRQCRYLTIMFFLNNVTRGGETAFQVADNKTFSYKHWEEESTTKCNLIENCQQSNLVIQPVQGKAILWYNHKVDQETGWMGDLDPMTFHGGCEVTEGNEKWIANTWLNVIGKKGSSESYKGWLSNERPLDEL